MTVAIITFIITYFFVAPAMDEWRESPEDNLNAKLTRALVQTIVFAALFFIIVIAVTVWATTDIPTGE